MKLYIAGKFQERKQVRWLMDRLVELGHTITFDWTTAHYETKEETPEDAVECVRGVINADAYVGVFIMDYTYKGALIEMGVALGLDKKVYIIGHAIDSLFIKHPNVQQFDNELEFLSYVRQIKGV